jgi:hypothetical protein
MFKMLLEAVDGSRLFSVGHLLNGQLISELQDILHDTEFLNAVLLFFMAKD